MTLSTRLLRCTTHLPRGRRLYPPLTILGTLPRSYHTSRPLLAPFQFKLHDIGEGITEVEIIKWHIEVGAKVDEFDNLCEVQSDKSVVDLTSPVAGIVTALNAEVGTTVRVGQTLCDIDDGAEAEAKARPVPEVVEAASEPKEAANEDAQAQGPAQPSPSTSMPRPPIQEAEPPIPEPTPLPPQSETTHAPSSTAVQLEGEAAVLPPPPATLLATDHGPVPPRHGSAPPRKEIVKTSPAIRAFAARHGVNLEDVQPTGDEGRVTRADVERTAGSSTRGSVENAVGASTPRRKTTTSGVEVIQSTTTVPMGRTRRVMYRAMTEMGAVPHFGYSHTLDLTALLPYLSATSSPIKIPYRASDVPEETASPLDRPEKVTILSLMVKTLLLALEEHPIMRSRATDKDLKISRHASIGIAVSDPKRGLLTPSLPALAARTPASDIAHHLLTLRSNPTLPTPAPHLTVSSIGSLGEGADAQPVLPPGGGLSICAIGRARWEIEPIVRDRGINGESVWNLGQEQVLAAGTRAVLRCPVGWSGDHRVLEGAELIAFTETWKKLVEEPARWVQA